MNTNRLQQYAPGHHGTTTWPRIKILTLFVSGPDDAPMVNGHYQAANLPQSTVFAADVLSGRFTGFKGDRRRD